MALFDNCIAYYKFDETTGTNATDIVGGLTLAATNTPAWAAGKINNGTDLEYSSSQLWSNSSAFAGATPSAFSFNVWIKPESSIAYQQVIFKYMNGSGGVSFRLQFDNADHFRGAVRRNGNNRDVLTTATMTAGNWYMITVVARSDGNYIYVNGSYDNKAATTDAIDAFGSSTYPFTVGGNEGGNEYFDGIVDELGIWDKALSTDEITELYNSGNGYTYAINATVTPSTLTLSTDEAEPVYSVMPQPLSLSSGLSIQNVKVVITYKSGGIGTSVIANRYPVTEGIIAKTTTQTGRITSLIPEESFVAKSEFVGL
jgi:hypothetical protein